MRDRAVARLVGIHERSLVGQGGGRVGSRSVGKDERPDAGLARARGGQADDVHGLSGAGVADDVGDHVDEVVAARGQQLDVMGAAVQSHVAGGLAEADVGRDRGPLAVRDRPDLHIEGCGVGTGVQHPQSGASVWAVGHVSGRCRREAVRNGDSDGQGDNGDRQREAFSRSHEDFLSRNEVRKVTRCLLGRERYADQESARDGEIPGPRV